jgi:hypothetical protein
MNNDTSLNNEEQQVEEVLGLLEDIHNASRRPTRDFIDMDMLTFKNKKMLKNRVQYFSKIYQEIYSILSEEQEAAEEQTTQSSPSKCLTHLRVLLSLSRANRKFYQLILPKLGINS